MWVKCTINIFRYFNNFMIWYICLNVYKLFGFNYKYHSTVLDLLYFGFINVVGDLYCTATSSVFILYCSKNCVATVLVVRRGLGSPVSRTVRIFGVQHKEKELLFYFAKWVKVCRNLAFEGGSPIRQSVRWLEDKVGGRSMISQWIEYVMACAKFYLYKYQWTYVLISESSCGVYYSFR